MGPSGGAGARRDRAGGRTMKPHILFAAYQVDRGSNGGMESATRIFEALADDFRWTLMTNRETARTARWRAGGADTVLFPFDEGAGRLARAGRLTLASLRALRVKADILHGNDIRGVQVLLPAARMRKVPLAMTLRDTKPEDERYGAHWQRMARRLHALVGLSDDMMRRVGSRLPVPQDRRHTINSIVDLDQFAPVASVDRAALRGRLGIGPGDIAIAMVAGVFDKKRQLDVIRHVMPWLQDQGIALHLVGDFDPDADPYAQACAKCVDDLDLGDRVTFHGFRGNAQDWLAAADIVLVASRREGLARCMIEAMACGTPVVSFDVCSAREMLEDTGAGVVVAQDDWTGLADALRDLAGDPDRRSRLGAAGQAAARRRFDARIVAGKWRDLYHILASGGAA